MHSFFHFVACLAVLPILHDVINDLMHIACDFNHPYSDEDEADNPLVAVDEDLSGPEVVEEPQKFHSPAAASKPAPRPSR